MVQPVTSESHTSTSANPSADDLSRQLEELKGDVSRLTETLGQYGKSKQREFSAEARRRYDEARGEAERRYDDVEAYVRQNPAQALGIAAGIGFIIGLMRR